MYVLLFALTMAFASPVASARLTGCKPPMVLLRYRDSKQLACVHRSIRRHQYRYQGLWKTGGRRQNFSRPKPR